MWTEELQEREALQAVRARFPDFAQSRLEPVRSGWDFHVFLANGTRIVRVPRRRAAEERLLREIALLPAIADRLPSPISRVEDFSDTQPLAVVMRRIEGTPAQALPRTGDELGRFLSALHAIPSEPLPLPWTDVADWRAAHEERREQFEQRVSPLLEASERERAARMFASVSFDFRPSLVHGDLAPEHILCGPDGEINGIIDWSDARIGDPAIDLAWALHGAGTDFAASVLSTYEGVDDELHTRAAFYHRRVPWYDALYGLERGRTDFVTRALAEIRDRLP